jgi:predicted Zn-dependent protease
MKTTNQQIEKENNSKQQPTQQRQEGIGVCVTRQSKEALLSLSATLEVAPLQIAERAIQKISQIH